jgi:hypothetical protein
VKAYILSCLPSYLSYKKKAQATNYFGIGKAKDFWIKALKINFKCHHLKERVGHLKSLIWGL